MNETVIVWGVTLLLTGIFFWLAFYGPWRSWS
jgi:hypothetical protein